MNKVININLGGRAFIIDENAFEYLKKYIDSLKKYFSKYEESADIIYDIESRLAEIIDESMAGREVISSGDLKLATQQMGTPEDFEMDEQKSGSSHRLRDQFDNDNQKSYSVGRKLMRDIENKRIAGVCSGLAQYFGIKDALYVRLIFVLLFFVGVAPLLYPLLWLIMPKPKNSADRLAMKGEDINYENIAKEVQEEFRDLKDRLTNIGK